MQPTQESLKSRICEINEKLSQHKMKVLSTKNEAIKNARHENEFQNEFNDVSVNPKLLDFLLKTKEDSNNNSFQISKQEEEKVAKATIEFIGPKTKTQLFEETKFHHNDTNEFSLYKEFSTYLSIDDIVSHKLTLEKIKQLPKFQNYNPGCQSKKLFVKNLPKNLTEQKLASLFLTFQISDNKSELLKFRLMKGKNRGQAFVNFPTYENASQALEIVNGYLLDNKPVIIEYGRSS